MRYLIVIILVLIILPSTLLSTNKTDKIAIEAVSKKADTLEIRNADAIKNDQVIFSDTLPAATNTASVSAGEQLNWQVISSGGTIGSSTNYILGSTVGQNLVGNGSSTNYILISGFWQDFSATSSQCCIGIRGNVDGDAGEVIDIVDLVYMVNYFYGGGAEPPCLEESDVDGDGEIDITDLVYLVNYFYIAGAEPVSCP